MEQNVVNCKTEKKKSIMKKISPHRGGKRIVKKVGKFVGYHLDDIMARNFLESFLSII